MRPTAEVWRRRAGRTLLALLMVAASGFSLWGGVTGLRSGVAPAPFRHEAPIPRAANPVGYWLAELFCLSVSPVVLVTWYRTLSTEVRADRSPTLTVLDAPDPVPTPAPTRQEMQRMQGGLWIVTGFVFVWAVFLLIFLDMLPDAAHGGPPPPPVDVGGWGAALLLLGGTLLYYLFQMSARNPNSPPPPGDTPRSPLRAPWPPLIGLVLLLCALGGADRLGQRPDAARTALILAAVTAALSGAARLAWPSRRR